VRPPDALLVRAVTLPPAADPLVTDTRAGAARLPFPPAGYSPPNFLISSNSASVRSRGTSFLATFVLCT
jgi:hypothetical protein